MLIVGEAGGNFIVYDLSGAYQPYDFMGMGKKEFVETNEVIPTTLHANVVSDVCTIEVRLMKSERNTSNKVRACCNGEIRHIYT